MADGRLLPAGIADERSRAFLELSERLEAIDLGPLLVYRIESVPASALFALAWQFGVAGLAGWNLATTEAERRELVRRAIELHRHKGTPWAIKEALRSVGWADIEILEGYGRPVHDGQHLYDGTVDHSSGLSWGYFRVIYGELAEDQTLTAQQGALLAGIVNTWKNARSQLADMGFMLPEISDALPAISEEPMAVTHRTFHEYDGTYLYDGTIDHVGSHADILVTS